jgi:glycosyltransferase involved in cell wall biosynthesis
MRCDQCCRQATRRVADNGHADFGAIRGMLPDIGKQLIMVGQTPRPEHFMQASDVLCLPSYREGFGNVIIEAAACGLPCVGSRIYGITDAVEDGVTGCLHLPRDVGGLHRLLQKMRIDAAVRLKMGEAARLRVTAHYSEAKVVGALTEFYRAELGMGEEASASAI